MSKQNLFVPKVKNNVSRNAFDLSQRKVFSQKCGEILPIFVRGCIPGDKVKVNASSFTRTAPLNTASFCRMKQYFNFYFVPYRLLYRDFPSFVVSQSKSSKSANGISSDLVVADTLPHVYESDLVSFTQSANLPHSGHPHSSMVGPNNTLSSLTSQLLNPFGFNRLTQSRKLLQYLGYYKLTCPDYDFQKHINNNTPLSLFPLLAYQKVYNDFYRFSQWENESARTYNVDYLSGSPSMHIPVSDLITKVSNDFGWIPKTSIIEDGCNMFDMRYVNFTKDSFLGVVPTSQFGAVSTIDPKIEKLSESSRMFLSSDDSNAKGKPATWQNNEQSTIGYGSTEVSVNLRDERGQNFLTNDLQTSFSILELRAAQARQKFMEVTLSNNSDYKSQVEAHFNVNVSSLMSGLCDYIGGFSADLSVDTVTNQNLTDGNKANYAANASMHGQGNFDFEVREHGIIIGVSYILPFIDWSVQGYDFENLRVDYDDFALPEFDRLGYEEVDPRLIVGDLIGSRTYGSQKLHLGYGPRYYDYKTNIDVVLGDFNEAQGGTQPFFTVNLNNNASGLKNLDQFFKEHNMPNKSACFTNGLIDDIEKSRVSAWSFKVSPTLLNNIFTVQCGYALNSSNEPVVYDDIDRDQFYNVLNLGVQVISNLDRLGLPY